jgi:putative redox protein
LATVHANVQLIREMEFRGRASNGHELTIDTSADHGGLALGLEPLDLVLLALGGCIGLDVISIMRKKRQEVTNYDLRITAEQSDEHPRVYTRIEIEHIVAGRNIDEQAVARSIELSETKYCPVSAMLRGTVQIHNRYHIINDDEHPVKLRKTPSPIGRGRERVCANRCRIAEPNRVSYKASNTEGGCVAAPAFLMCN